MILSISSLGGASSPRGTVDIVDIFSDENLCDTTIRFNEPVENAKLVFEMLHNGELVDLITIDIGSVPAGEVTKIVFWRENELEYNYYNTTLSVYVSNELAGSASYPFTYNTISLPRFRVMDFSADSSKATIVISPTSIYKPGVLDIVVKLLKGDEVVYKETMDNVAILQSKEIQIKWPVLLESKSEYTATLLAYSHDPDITVSYISDFTASEDVDIIDDEVDVDEFGASVDIIGRSQVPFKGTVLLELEKDRENIVFEEKSEILINNKDDTIGVVWNDLPGGEYNVTIYVLTPERTVLDSYETIIRLPEPIILGTEVETNAPGFGFIGGLVVLAISGMLIRRF
ncbi:MAG: hypothetical protein JXA38_02150 [Methanosarcinaceae archaeon]|nr:hypothetical protein [Methanosarcinaceae archaeon]